MLIHSLLGAFSAYSFLSGVGFAGYLCSKAPPLLQSYMAACPADNHGRSCSRKCVFVCELHSLQVCSPKEMVLALLEQMEALSVGKKPLLVFMMLDPLKKGKEGRW